MGVEAAPCQQLDVGALLHQAAFVQHQDLVGGQDGGQPVSDNEAGAAWQQRDKPPPSADAGGRHPQENALLFT